MQIVFLPGLLCDDAVWKEQANALRDIAATTIADLTLDSSVREMAQRTLGAAPSQFILVALSMGGYVAFEMLRQAPDRVSGLVLLDTSASPDTPERRAQRKAGMASLKVGKFAGVTNHLLPDLLHPKRLHGPVAEGLKAMAQRVGGEAFLRQQEAILGRPDSRPMLGELRMPTLVAVGDFDVLTPPQEALDIHLGIRTSQFQIIRDCGHLPPLEQPELVSRMLRQFIEQLPTGS